ncbi:MAG: 4-hydroxy-2-oxoglutarate aldolase @ 2-dehydro-3-deoxyphosphogluconate aldolase [uncultured Sphingomonas sp.]|uniref:2-dehydro-3-deoxy-phosphogluconate aldolase n=1 Tax=uncultured Sphingomonas sp. TaxID=158754 RepID=A0A6J4TCF7_9SPHN|nr:bifunctional 4-hydroxy-2-oxoglutarate aldolase/2-dehydro-3-deoxy-phosphogluconate aldolase [uncultured Sphingomonas sp.]CAA9518619.1 MAG: 4-hydroxy-2-oxoglutarate aldolase @ 2-dehydro-3-deoxyphosphogluconate aldolase [uncultured Sphingomonas sp.]
MRTIDEIMSAAPVIPVLILDGSIDPAALAETLVASGLPVLEVTLRTPHALDAIRAMAKVPGAIVGAGTVVNRDQLGQAQDAGATFVVAPGLTEGLSRAVLDSGLAYLPGVSNAGDIMRGIELGLDRFKFFPAIASGGLPTLKSLSEPFASVRFCPTGGITAENAPDWLAHPAVRCVGGTWIVPKGDTDPSQIGQLARAAAALRPA